MILGLSWPVSFRYRAEMMEAHEDKTQEKFLDAIWSARDGGYFVRHGFPIVKGDWPVRRAEPVTPSSFAAAPIPMKARR